MVIRKLFSNEGFSAILQYAIAGISAIFQVNQLKGEDLVVRKLLSNEGFSAILQYAIAGFYCIALLGNFSKK